MSNIISIYLICMLNFIRVCAKVMELVVTYVLGILIFSLFCGEVSPIFKLAS
jgi:hypothetical protein